MRRSAVISLSNLGFAMEIPPGEFNDGWCDEGQDLQDAKKYVGKTLVAHPDPTIQRS
jgi:hypothetical protein